MLSDIHQRPCLLLLDRAVYFSLDRLKGVVWQVIPSIKNITKAQIILLYHTMPMSVRVHVLTNTKCQHIYGITSMYVETQCSLNRAMYA